MAFKAVLLCASALLVQSISAGCANRISVPSCGCSDNLRSGSILSSGSALSGLSSSVVSNNGGAFNVQSLGPISPAGIAVATELALAADLAVSGTLPFLSAVAFEGSLPTSGAGSVSYGCGDGSVGITGVVGNSNSASSIRGVGVNGGCGCRL